MERPSREQVLMEVAQLIARRSTCQRRHVGAILTLDSRIISMGYAGAPAGARHCGFDVCDVNLPCTRTIHAEANAIAFAARHGVPTDGSELYSTASPCIDCAKLIISAGVRHVFYLEEYRDLSPVLIMVDSGIRVERFKLP